MPGSQKAGVGGIDIFQPIRGPANDFLGGIREQDEIVGVVPQPAALFGPPIARFEVHLLNATRLGGRVEFEQFVFQRLTVFIRQLFELFDLIVSKNAGEPDGRPAGKASNNLESKRLGGLLEDQPLMGDAVFEFEGIEGPIVAPRRGGHGHARQDCENESGQPSAHRASPPRSRRMSER